MKYPFASALLLAFFMSTNVDAAEMSGGLYEPEPPADSAYVRVIAIGTQGFHDVLVDNNIHFRKLANGSASDYMILKAGQHAVELIGSDSSTKPISAKINIGVRRTISVIFDTGEPSASPLIIEEKTINNMQKAQLIFYNLDKKLGPLDLLTEDGKIKIFSDMDYGQAHSIQVNPISITLNVLKSSDKSIQGKVKMDMTSGTTYTIFTISDQNGNTTTTSQIGKLETYVK